MIISTLTDSALFKFCTMCGFCWVLGKEKYHSDSGPIQLANLIDMKLARFRASAGNLCNWRGLFSADNYYLSLELSWEDDS